MVQNDLQMFLDYVVHMDSQQMSHAVRYSSLCKGTKFSTLGTARVKSIFLRLLPVPVAGVEEVVTPPYGACVLIAL
jgi:hypothetical protein